MSNWSRGAKGLAPLALAIGVALLAFTWLRHVNPTFDVTDDGLRDQLLVRDCTDLGRCHLIGSPMSVPFLYNGAAWLDLLTATHLLGGDSTTDLRLVLSLLAVGVATIFIVTWHWLRPSMALPAAVLLTGALGLDRIPSMLANGSVSGFPDAVTTAGLLCYGLSGQRRFLLAAAFALAIAIDVHVGSLTLVPALIALAVLARPRPWRSLLTAVLVLAVTYFVVSSATVRANVIGLRREGLLLPALIGCAAVVLFGARFGPHFRRQSATARALIVAVILVVPFALASLWLVFRQGHHFAIYYFHPIAAPAAVLAAAAVTAPFESAARWLGAIRWVPTAAVLVAIALVIPSRAPPTQVAATARMDGWSLPEAAAIAERVAAHGWTYEDLVFHLQGQSCRELLIGMSVAAPPPSPTRPEGHRQLQIVKLASNASVSLPASAETVRLGSGTAAVIRDVDSWLRPMALTACTVPASGGQTPSCSSATPFDPDTRRAERFLFSRRSFPEIHRLPRSLPYVERYEIPLSPIAGQTRDLTLTEGRATKCDWHITRVEGVEVEGSLPARSVRLHSGSGGPGWVVIERPFGTVDCPTYEVDVHYPPCVFEAEPGDPLGIAIGRQG